MSMLSTSLKIDRELREQAEKWCKEHDRTFGWLVRTALKQFLSSYNS